MKRIVISTMVSLAVGSAMLACGGSDDKKATGPSGGTGGGSAAGSENGGSGTGGDSNGSGGTSNGSGGASGGTCVASACQGRTLSFGGNDIQLDGCCSDPNTCGYSFQGNCVPKSTVDQYVNADGGIKLPEGGLPGNETVVIDPTCPDLQFPADAGVGGFGFDAGSTNSLQGCCDKTNVCGYAFSVSFGAIQFSQCFTAADLQGFPGGPGGGGLNVDAGPPKSCTFPKK
ncbi:MAG TPA: hypothetical protein VHE30_02630 [Polyangiaceae bacterium]|nr:hypothetical protein [Polyangiaceae bacterium]